MTGALLPGGIVISAETVITLADLHVARFAQLIEVSGNGGVRVDECARYLDLWRSIRASTVNDTELDSEQRGELFEALFSGEYDVHLSPAEFLAVHRPESRAS